MADHRIAAIIGSGLIGGAWSVAFARAGWVVQLYDNRAGAAKQYHSWAEATWRALVTHGLLSKTESAQAQKLVRVCDTMSAALEGVEYVQEAVAETRDVKSAVFADIDKDIGPQAVVGSSSSGIPGSEFMDNCANRARMLICHPVNPPHLVPVVELVPTPWTEPNAVETARTIMSAIGQTPIVVRREIGGFVLNRLQGALLNEAWALYEDGIASLDDIDATVRDGLGLRWEFMGPFETIDLNAPKGIDDYAARFRKMYASMGNGRKKGPWSDDIIKKATAERAKTLPRGALADKAKWRDSYLMNLLAFRKSQKG